jgi:class 3 adenylate cyclase
VLHSDYVDTARARYLAYHITGARPVAVPGSDVLFFGGDHEPVINEVAQFLTGERLPIEVDRVLTTVLFTDIVGSTERAASLGDRRWRSFLDAHDQAVRDQLRPAGERGRHRRGMALGRIEHRPPQTGHVVEECRASDPTVVDFGHCGLARLREGNWSAWYASYMVAEQAGTDLPA